MGECGKWYPWRRGIGRGIGRRIGPAEPGGGNVGDDAEPEALLPHWPKSLGAMDSPGIEIMQYKLMFGGGVSLAELGNEC